jgi:hypothetical protein
MDEKHSHQATLDSDLRNPSLAFEDPPASSFLSNPDWPVPSISHQLIDNLLTHQEKVILGKGRFKTAYKVKIGDRSYACIIAHSQRSLDSEVAFLWPGFFYRESLSSISLCRSNSLLS